MCSLTQLRKEHSVKQHNLPNSMESSGVATATRFVPCPLIALDSTKQICSDLHCAGDLHRHEISIISAAIHRRVTHHSSGSARGCQWQHHTAARGPYVNRVTHDDSLAIWISQMGNSSLYVLAYQSLQASIELLSSASRERYHHSENSGSHVDPMVFFVPVQYRGHIKTGQARKSAAVAHQLPPLSMAGPTAGRRTPTNLGAQGRPS